MADIEERAERWAREYTANHNPGGEILDSEDLIAAYLAGSAQTQADYTASEPRPGSPCERHGNVGCAWCIPGPYDECPRCECTCGAR